MISVKQYCTDVSMVTLIDLPSFIWLKSHHQCSYYLRIFFVWIVEGMVVGVTSVTFVEGEYLNISS